MENIGNSGVSGNQITSKYTYLGNSPEFQVVLELWERILTEVKDDDDPTLELLYETVYHTPVVITGLLKDIPNRLVPIGDLEITRGGFEEEMRDGDEDIDQRLESVALQVVERVLEEEDKNDKQVACVSCY